MTWSAVVPETSSRRSDNLWGPILAISTSLVAATDAVSRARAIVHGIRELVPCDSAVLLRLEGTSLVPVAASGLVPETASQRFVIAEHPRLAQFMRASGPLRITDPSLPDPFDGLIGESSPLSRVHACVGCPLVVGGAVIGVLALDALDPHALDHVGDDEVAAVAGFAAAALRVTELIDQAERAAAQATQVARDLERDTAARAGDDLIGTGPAIAALRGEVQLAGASDLSVLITGETGAGKEVVARAIHAASARRERPLIYVNCAALPESIAESELFGHVRGSFTGANEHRAGKFEVADGGTLFLDEIGELPLAIQPKLLRVLQSGEIQRVGSDKLARVDVRIVAATNRELASEIAAGRFRADLFHRLGVFPIRVPSLREHREDIAVLAGHFLDEARLRLGLGRVRLTASARAALEGFDWPGNVRELEHAILRGALRASGGRRHELVVIDAPHLGLAQVPNVVIEAAPTPVAAPILAPAPAPVAESLPASLAHLKRQRVLDAIAAASGNWAQAARMLSLDRSNFHRLARRLGITRTRETCVVGDEA